MADVNWRRVFAISSLVMALLLVGGSIYLHVRQKHHLGRMRHESNGIISYGSVATAVSTIVPQTPVSVATAAYLSSVESTQSSESNESLDLELSTKLSSSLGAVTPAVTAAADESALRLVTEACLECICETTTQCHTSTCSSGVACGLFRISLPYWTDAGKPILEGDISDIEDNGYLHCVNNPYCAGRTVGGFIKKYARDCNQDGVIDCRDHIALHILGPNGCMQKKLMPVFETRMENCLATFE